MNLIFKIVNTAPRELLLLPLACEYVAGRGSQRARGWSSWSHKQIELFLTFCRQINLRVVESLGRHLFLWAMQWILF